MPIDASIPLQVKPPQFMNPSQMLSLKQMALQGQQQEQEIGDKNALRQAYKDPGFADPTTGEVTPQGLARVGQINPVMRNQLAQQNQQMAAQKQAQAASAVAMQFQKLNINEKQNEMISQALTSIWGDYTTAKATLPPDEANRRFSEVLSQKANELEKSGNFSPEQIAGMRQITSPDHVPMLISGSKAYTEFMKLRTPKIEKIDTGGGIEFKDTNPLSNPGITGTTIKKTPTIGETESARHNVATEANASILARQGWERINVERTKANQEKLGNPTEVTVNGAPRLAAFDKQSRSWIDAGTGQRIAGDVAPKASDTEQKTAGYEDRMRKAEQTMATVPGGQTPGLVESAVAGVPLTGKVMANVARGDERQQYRQAQEDWVRAKLRQESGAVIADEEMDREIRTYFPQLGDSPAVIKQKAASRQTAIGAMRTASGPAAKPASKPIARAPSKPPSGVDQLTWDHMTPDERKLFQ